MVPFCFAHERLLLYVDVHLALFFDGGFVFHGYILTGHQGTLLMQNSYCDYDYSD